MEVWSMSLVRLLKEVAKNRNLKLNILKNGAIIVIKDGKAMLQIATVRDLYYFRYLDDNGAYVIYHINREILEKILDKKADEVGAIRIPDV
ncbi:hypothetical protein [Saccharolobus shibatae]|uniref:hypothetical protein n=1 Tax=Saccharolobus shibatae TaxID=2286 RepID=UPI0021BBCEA4|nr:hypothetical protein [Saccharolobus shibatae]